MCGIGAILDPAWAAAPDAARGASQDAGADEGRRMVHALRHRGPDGEAVRRTGPVLLAHTRLAIIDVAGGDQPLDSEDGAVTAIVNGEIYNHRELRAALESAGHRFATGSDSETVVHAYEEHGPDLVRHLNGIFAFALWDARRQRLVAARDQFGVKPLYWLSDGREDPVEVAHEVRAVLLVSVDHGLRVGAGGEPVPGRLQRGPQLAVVVDLAVDDRRDRAVLRVEGLVAAGHVDDGQPGVGEQDRAGARGAAVANSRPSSAPASWLAPRAASGAAAHAGSRIAPIPHMGADHGRGPSCHTCYLQVCRPLPGGALASLAHPDGGGPTDVRLMGRIHAALTRPGDHASAWSTWR